MRKPPLRGVTRASLRELKKSILTGEISLLVHHPALSKSVSRTVTSRFTGSLATDPVVTAESVSQRLQASPAAAHRALTELHDAGILGRSKDQKGRTICWTADRPLALVALTERSNRVGGEDTLNRKPKLGPAAPPLKEHK